MKVKSQEWIQFKKNIIEYIKIFEGESGNFEFPIDDEEDFALLIEDCEVHPIFTKKEDFLKIEYDLTFCNTRIRLLSCSKFKESVRIEMSLK